MKPLHGMQQKKILFYLNNTNIKKIALYWPMQYELDTRPLIKLLLEKNMSISLPSILSNQIKFLNWNLNDTLVFDKLKFYHPKKNAIQTIPNIVQDVYKFLVNQVTPAV